MSGGEEIDHRLAHLTTALEVLLPPAQRDQNAPMEASHTDVNCTNPSALDPEEMECNCYGQFAAAGNCTGVSSIDQAKCIQCEICKVNDTAWKKPLCSSWKAAV